MLCLRSIAKAIAILALLCIGLVPSSLAYTTPAQSTQPSQPQIVSPHISATFEIPFNPDFPQARYPYAQQPNGCGELGPELAPNWWGSVHFEPACSTYDRCVYTPGTSAQSCTQTLCRDLAQTCTASITPTTVSLSWLGGLELAPDPQRQQSCQRMAARTCAAVNAVASRQFHQSQLTQARYNEWLKWLSDHSAKPTVASLPEHP